ncbi:MAG: hypothetical protein GKC10_00185 [Methanosarcinales archaeon]|nr:hypothetical protein [Methanosarcinales archaeon]
MTAAMTVEREKGHHTKGLRAMVERAMAEINDHGTMVNELWSPDGAQSMTAAMTVERGNVHQQKGRGKGGEAAG